MEIIGNLGADAQIKEIGGKNYIACRAASTAKRGQAEETTWVSVMYYANDKLLPYLKKGSQVYASGDVRISTYTNRDGIVSVDVTLWAKSLQLVGRRDEPQTPYEDAAVKSYLERQKLNAQMAEAADGDVPF